MPNDVTPHGVTIVLPPALLALFPGCPNAPIVTAQTVSHAIDALDARWPGLRQRICDETPAIRRHIHIFVAGERAALHTPLPPGTEMVVVTAISGG